MSEMSFDGLMFMEFVMPVFFDGVGYVDKVAFAAQYSDAKSPTLLKGAVWPEGYALTLHSGATSRVSHTNVKFLAGKRPGVVDGARDGEKEGVRGKSVASDSDEGEERQASTQEVPSTSATPATLPDGKLSHTDNPKPVPSPKGPPPRRRGAW